MKKVLIVSTANLSVKPRMVKDIHVASKHYKVDIIIFKTGTWGDSNDIDILNNYNLNNVYVLSALRKPFFSWLYASLLNKMCYYMQTIFPANLQLCAYASNKRSILLKKFLYKLGKGYNLVLSRGLSTLYPCYKYSVANGIPYLFDMEDYHPGEVVEDKKEMFRRYQMLKKIIPKISFLTYSAPSFIYQLMCDIQGLSIKNKDFIPNSFYSYEFDHHYSQPASSDRVVSFVWFSWQIGYNRGLEDCINNLSRFKQNVQLTLVGNCDEDFYKHYILPNRDFITIQPLLKQDELHRYLTEFDIGLAVESVNDELNRDLCLTNKIFAYLQAGLYIMVTATTEQKRFMQEWYEHGCLVDPYNIDQSYKNAIDYIMNNIASIRLGRNKRLDNAKTIAFEEQEKKLLKIWESVIN